MPEPAKQHSTGSSLQSTKQLLDELDALMERMLALPVDESESAAAETSSVGTATTEAPEDDTPVEETDDTMDDHSSPYVEDEPIEDQPSYSYDSDEDNDTESGDSSEEFARDYEPEDPFSDEEEQDYSPAGELQPVSAASLSTITKPVPPPNKPPVVQQSRLLRAGAARRSKWWLWPLTSINRLFDLLTYFLGPVGGWLREPSGRTFLGWLGLALLLAAIGLQLVVWFAM